METWWQVLIVAFSGGFIGGTVAYYLDTRKRTVSAKRVLSEKIEE